MQKAAWQGRGTGAILALLVQVLFLWALWFATVRHFERTAGRETILFLHPSPPAPSMIDARGDVGTSPIPRRAATVPFSPPLQSMPQGDLSGFGRALFGCAPENYSQLSPEDRKYCPKPGDAVDPPPDLLGNKSHVKDGARWANALAHRQSPLLLPGGFNFPLALLGAVMDGSIADSSSAFRDPEKWSTYGDAPKVRDPHDAERGYEAWRRPVYQQPGLR